MMWRKTSLFFLSGREKCVVETHWIVQEQSASRSNVNLQKICVSLSDTVTNAFSSKGRH